MFARLRNALRRDGPVKIATILADRVVRRAGISLLSFTRFGAVSPAAGDSPSEIFDNTARHNMWGSAESISGGGSEIGFTADYRARLAKLLPRFHSMFDAPCDDMNWMRQVLEEVPIAYYGGDISAHVIELNRAKFPHLKFDLFDITRNAFSTADVWHCRDCLFHLSYADIRSALDNFAASDIPYALITSHAGVVRNMDIRTGGWRHLNLLRAPFHLPPPELRLKDHQPGDLPRYVGLWRREQLVFREERTSPINRLTSLQW